jgi:hypothetical protein
MELPDDLAGLVEDVQSLGFKVERGGGPPLAERSAHARGHAGREARVSRSTPDIGGSRSGRHRCELKLREPLPRVGPDSNRPLDRR